MIVGWLGRCAFQAVDTAYYEMENALSLASLELQPLGLCAPCKSGRTRWMSSAEMPQMYSTSYVYLSPFLLFSMYAVLRAFLKPSSCPIPSSITQKADTCHSLPSA
ncbi:hypothetical protein HGRIS_011991 [Hohenbuehelia grisea]|uniref:Uncharacterized protein n=1 Tax=Hohenbuehelia grisea TaxID=104357 RepID=A0ABR3JXR7_9AGAR